MARENVIGIETCDTVLKMYVPLNDSQITYICHTWTIKPSLGIEVHQLRIDMLLAKHLEHKVLQCSLPTRDLMPVQIEVIHGPKGRRDWQLISKLERQFSRAALNNS